MRFRGKTKIVAGGVVLLVLGGGGGALATTVFSSPSAQNSAIISDAATQLNVAPSALSTALTKAIDDQLNAEVTAGQLSQAQATALEARLASGQAPLFNLGGPVAFRASVGVGLAGGLGAAETYLGLSATQIRTDMKGGQTLAQIAVAQDKTAAGLVAALVSAEEAKLSAAVTAGTLSSTQETTIETNLQNAITALVNGTTAAGVAPGPLAGVAPFAPAGRGGVTMTSVPFMVNGGPFGDLSAAAGYLGVSGAQLRSDLQGGKSLAQIAVAAGKTSAGLVAALVSAETSKLFAAVTAGKLTSAQESAMVTMLTRLATAEVNRPVLQAPGLPSTEIIRPGGFGITSWSTSVPPRVTVSAVPAGSLAVITSYLGLSAPQIRTDLRNGQTLAQIAVAQGKTADGLIAALVSAQESKLSAEVTAGTLGSAAESMIEQNLQNAISAEVNATAPAALRLPRGVRFGAGPGGTTWVGSATTTTATTTIASG